MTIVALPVSSDGSQRFTSQLGSQKFVFEVKYNDRSGVWTMDVFDAASEAAILNSLPLVLGQDLLEPYNLGIGSIVVVDTTNAGRDAGPDDLGTRVMVYWLSADEVV